MNTPFNAKARIEMPRARQEQKPAPLPSCHGFLEVQIVSISAAENGESYYLRVIALKGDYQGREYEFLFPDSTAAQEMAEGFTYRLTFTQNDSGDPIARTVKEAKRLPLEATIVSKASPKGGIVPLEVELPYSKMHLRIGVSEEVAAKLSKNDKCNFSGLKIEAPGAPVAARAEYAEVKRRTELLPRKPASKTVGFGIFPIRGGYGPVLKPVVSAAAAPAVPEKAPVMLRMPAEPSVPAKLSKLVAKVCDVKTCEDAQYKEVLLEFYGVGAFITIIMKSEECDVKRGLFYEIPMVKQREEDGMFFVEKSLELVVDPARAQDKTCAPLSPF